MKLSAKHLAVWENGQRPNARTMRYVPKSLTGGTGWGVWDGRDQRFLSEAEIRKIDTDEPRRLS